MTLLLGLHKLSAHIDGSSVPDETVTVDGKSAKNPEFTSWTTADQKAALLLLSSLTEEAATEVLGISSARQIWVALENTYSNASIERVQTLRDSLQQLKKGSSSVTDFSRKFKLICEQLVAIGHPVAETDKIHWFLRGLGPSYEGFSIVIRAVKPAPLFRDLVSQAESHDLFSQSLHETTTPPAAFHVHHKRESSTSSRGRGSYRGTSSRGSYARGRSNNRRPPHCQWCRKNGHYASACPDLKTFATRSSTSDDDLVKAFHAQCHVTHDTPDWTGDTGATDHMTSTQDCLHHSTPYKGNNQVTFGNGKRLSITHIGSSKVGDQIPLRNVLVVPHLTKNLLSISKLTNDLPVDVLFSKNFFHIQDRTTKQVLARGTCVDGLYVLRNEPQALVADIPKKASYELWHARLGHVSFDVISTLNKTGCLSLTSLLPKPDLCLPCQLAKSQRLSFVNNEKRASFPLDLIHCDLWGPAPIASTDGYRYYVVFIDDYSRFTWFYPLTTKTGFYAVLSAFIQLVQTQFSRKIKTFQSDGGGEFLNHTVRKIFEANGTFHRFSCPHTPQQNGRAERKHRHIVETGLAMLFNAHVPASFWVDAFTTATYVINRVPTPLLQHKSPFQMLFDHLPNYSNFRVFGCLVFPYLRDYAKHKLEPRSLPCLFLGYSSSHKGFRCLDPSTNRIFISRHARFDESSFPFKGTTTSLNSQQFLLTTFCEDLPITSPIPHTSPPSPPGPIPSKSPTNSCPVCTLSPTPSQAHNTSPQATSPESTNQPSPQQNTTEPAALPPEPTTLPAEPIPQTIQSTPTPPETSAVPESLSCPAQTDSTNTVPNVPNSTIANAHPMMTQAKSGIFKPKHQANFAALHSYALHVALSTNTEPRGFKTAAKDPKWMAAMVDEIQALRHNNTWTLVPRPSCTNVVGSKWVFRIKYHSDGSIDRYKARLVAQGFTQIPGLDYSHTFSPVVKASTIRIVLSLAVLNKWNLHQLDVKNAFLNGDLNETVFMEQPPGFVNLSHPDYVCKLSKALYGLKQAPRAWFQRLSTFLLSYGFICSRADSSLFILRKDTHIMYLLVYVDDLILTGNDDTILRSFISRLHREFAIKDLGSLNYFLGLEVVHTDTGLFLTQAKYAKDILLRAKLFDSKPVHTPLAPHESFTASGVPYSDPTSYRSLVGALQYLTITRPDLSYAVNQLSQFLHCPTVDHFRAVKRLLRYVKGTISFGLSYSRSHPPDIVGYSDADWARCLDTRRSTYGYSIFLGGNLVSWSAKKQPTVSRSSCESEYRAMANTAAELVWITHLLRELHALPPTRPTLLCDNKSALFMTQNPVSHKRAKHIDLDYHFIRELVNSGKLYTKFVPTNLQVADIFTKSLPRAQFVVFRDMLRLGPPPFRLKGGIRGNDL
ncbi:putative RNA-directed DNA polymerase [Helianthus debilis subsp. tardiflorus]